MIVQSGEAVPDDYYESFIKAGNLKIISSDLAEKLAPSAGLRNRLVHEYDRIEHSMVLEAVSMAEELYPIYIKEINDYLSVRTWILLSEIPTPPIYDFCPFRLTEKELLKVHGNNERIALENLRFGMKAMVDIIKDIAA